MKLRCPACKSEDVMKKKEIMYAIPQGSGLAKPVKASKAYDVFRCGECGSLIALRRRSEQ